MEITKLLQGVNQGDSQALQTVIPLVYDELKKLAAGHLRRESAGGPLQTTALVHEAFLRLAQGQHPSYENRSHFFGIASRLMRQILVDMARARVTEKRNYLAEVQLEEIPDIGRQPDESGIAAALAGHHQARRKHQEIPQPNEIAQGEGRNLAKP